MNRRVPDGPISGVCCSSPRLLHSSCERASADRMQQAMTRLVEGLAQFVARSLEIVRDRSLELHRDLRARVQKLELPRMQSRSAQLPLDRSNFLGPSSQTAVNRVAEQWMSEFREVNSNLVGPPGL